MAENIEESKRQSSAYIFADGPNYIYGSKHNFQVDFEKFKTLISRKCGIINRFIWYEVEPEIFSVDYGRRATPKLERMMQSSQTGLSVDDILKDKKAMRELLHHYDSFDKSQRNYEGRNKFLDYIAKHAEIVLARGKSYCNETKCPNCNNEVQVVGKTEAGITDLNLSVDLVHYSNRDLFDWGVLISGDGHFSKAVNCSREAGKKVLVVSYDNMVSQKLIDSADDYLSFDSIRALVERTRNNGTRYISKLNCLRR